MNIRSTAFSLAAAMAAFSCAALEGALPDATHAWGTNDGRCPYPEKISADRTGMPSDATHFKRAADVGKALAHDCQLHFTCRSLSRLAYFGKALDLEAKPGDDGWVVVDAVLHAGGEGHAGYAMVFVNGLLAFDARVDASKGAAPFAVDGKEVCRIWARPSPPPWAEKLCGAYADRALIAESRRKTAERIVFELENMEEKLPGSKWGEGKVGFATRRIGHVISAYSYCRDEKFEKLFRTECDALAEKIRNDDEYGEQKGRLLTISRQLYPLFAAKVIDEEFPLWKAIAERGVKPWG